MALTCTYKSSGYGSTFNTTDIEIIGSSTGIFMVADGGMRFNQVTDERDQHARWSGMSVEFTILIEDSNNSALNTFISDITSTTEEKFFVKVSINSSMVFMGILNMSGSEWADDKNARAFRVSAYDGMGRLEGKNFANDSDNPYGGGGWDTIENAINYCMSKTGTGSQFGATPYLLILHDAEADGQTVTGNPMSNQRVDYNIWQVLGKDGLFTFKTARQVMEDIMIAYGLCLRYVGPHFLLYKPKMLATGGNAYAYDGSGSYMGTVAIAGAMSLDNSRTLTNFHRANDAGFSALTPYNKALIKYDHGDQNTNLLLGLKYQGSNIPTPGTLPAETDAGIVSVAVGEKINLRFSGKLRIRSQYTISATNWRNHRFRFRLRLRIESTSGATVTDMWWQRDHIPIDFYVSHFASYRDSYWNTSSSEYYDIVTDIVDEFHKDINLFFDHGFDTAILPAGSSNRVFFTFQFVNVFDENNNDVIAFQGYNPIFCDWEFSDLLLEAVQDGNIVNRPTSTDYTALGDKDNSDYWSGNTHIGDGPTKTSAGRLQALVSGQWRDTSTWGGKKLLEKTVSEILANRETSVGILTGSGYSIPYWFDRGLSYGGKTYLPMSIQYESGIDRWSGEWIEFKVGAGSGTTKINVVMKKEQVDLPKNPNRLPDDERLEDRITKIVTGTDRYVKDDTYTELELREAAETDLWNEGDIIWIKDPVIGYSEKITIKTDVKQGDTIVEIEPWTPDNDFPPGSYLELDTKLIIRHRYYAIDTDFSGTEWTITGWDLPDPTKWSVGTRTAEIRKRLAVTVNGQKKIYLLDIEGDRWMKGFTIDVSGVNNKIIFLEAVPDRSVVEVIYDV